MTYPNNVLRPGMTAIAAVLALSSTQSLAQDAATITEAPPTPVAVPEPVAEPAPAPEPVATETAPAAAEPTPAAVAAASPQRIRAARAQAPVRRAAAPVRPTAATVSAPVAAADTAPAEAAPIAAPTEAVAPPPIPIQAAAPAEASAADDMLPIAGIAGAGVLALAGGAVALRRRRRHSDEVSYEPETIDRDYVAAAQPEPLPVAPVAARAAPPPTAMPAGIDLSRFGRHTQAAYRGPTPDNPSLSLKRRLKRAAFFDGRERRAGDSAATVTPQPTSAPADASLTTKVAARPEAPAFAPRSTKRPASQPLFGFGQPAFQS